MSERKWLPSEYMDEVVPPLRAAPSDWIMKLDDGGFALDPAEDGVGDGIRVLLNDGDVIEFDWCELLGHVEIAYNDDGTWRITEGAEPTAPEGCSMNVWEPGNAESVMDSLVEFADSWRKTAHETQVTAECYCWSEKSVKFAFYAGAFHPMPSTTSLTEGVS